MDRTNEINAILTQRYREINTAHKHRSPLARSCKYIQVESEDGIRVEEIKEFVIHEFSMGDVEDPDLYAAEPLLEWEQSDIGQWVMKNAADVPTWHRMADMASYGYRYQIRARFFGPALTEYLLRKSK